jgi:hypothetical protein
MSPAGDAAAVSVFVRVAQAPALALAPAPTPYFTALSSIALIASRSAWSRWRHG